MRLAATTERLADGLRDAAAGRYPVQVLSAPGLLTVFFSERPMRLLRRRAQACDLPAHAAWCRELLAAASTRRPRSSRHGSPRWPTRERGSCERTLLAAEAAFAALDGRSSWA